MNQPDLRSRAHGAARSRVDVRYAFTTAQTDAERLARIVERRASGQSRLDKRAWTAMFRAIGLDDEDMRHWHAQFERSRPEAHRAFLASLGIPAAEIARIRRWALR